MKQLLLIHGALGAADQLIPLQELLKPHFNVHLLELEGHGVSARVGTPFSLERFRLQLNETLKTIGEPAHVFGYSMGGFVTLCDAAGGNEKIKSIITLGTKMKWSPEIASQEVKQLNPEVIKEKVPKFADSLQKRHGDHWEEVLNRTAEFMKDLGVLQPIGEDQMKAIDIPVLLCLADQDRMVSEEETLQVNEWIEGSKMKTIRESKHPIEQVNLMALSDTIRSFIHSIH